MKRISIILPLLLFFAFTYGQKEDAAADTSAWKTGGLGTVTFSQVSLYQWAAGGDPSISGAAMLNVFANYKGLNQSWDNTLDLGYGIIKQGDMTRKSNDRLEFSSKYGRRVTDTWNYSALLNFRTQFDNGYKYYGDTAKTIISKFMAPAYLTASLGMDYKPNKNLSIFLSPVTGKFTFVLDDSLAAGGNFGLDPGDKFRAELGGFVKIEYSNEIMTNVNLASKLDLFSNYLHNPQNIDINLEIMLSMKINEYLSASISAMFIYDDDVDLYKTKGSLTPEGPGWQIKEVFGLGFSYKF